MNNLSTFHKKSIAFFLFLAFASWSAFLAINIFKNGNNGNVLQVSDDVDVTATIYGCMFNITAKPEKRIPATNNWSTALTVEIYTTSNTLLGDFTTTTDSAGVANVNICDEGIFLSGVSNYHFYLKGDSNLKMAFFNVPAFEFSTTTIDFTPGPLRLINGETSNNYDNTINSLDISTQVSNINTSNTKNDLNRDSEVNTLDISNTVTNFGLSGDCSPQDVANGYCS